MRWVIAIDHFTSWLIAAGYTQATIRHHRQVIRLLAGANLRRSPWRIKTADLVDWLASQNWSAETLRNRQSTVRAFYQWGIKAGHTRHNPAAGLPRVRSPHYVPRPTPDAVTVVAFASASDRDRLILYLAAYAGLRRAEIAGLRWNDISAEGIRVKGKGGRARVVPLHPELRRELAEEAARRRRGKYGTGYRYTACRCGCVFPGQQGGPMTPNALGKAATKALGDGWGAHSLRHRFATRAYRGSRDLLAVQALLGHSNPETTKRYTELATDALGQVVANV